MKKSTSKSRAPSKPNSRPAATRPTTLSPDLKSETVLLSVTGMSPAILTETVWALAHEAEPVLPNRIVVVTTTEGRRLLQEQLFKSTSALGNISPWEALRQALSAKGHDLTGRLRFGCTGDDVRVITACDPTTGITRELTDLRSPADNDAAADFLLEQVRAQVENPDTRLIASLAGGRKTMGALLYACMTLIGRETDRLTHVLVNDPFDTLRGFWFPGQPGGAIGKPDPVQSTPRFEPSTAVVELADVPFVPLRNLFRRELCRPAGRFGLLVDSCREEVRRAAGEGVRLTIEQSQCRIEVNGTPLRLAPREQIVLLFLATRAKQGEPVLGSYREAIDPLNEFRERLRQTARPNDFSDWRWSDALKSKFDEDQELRKALSSIREKLRKVGGNARLLEACLPVKGRFSLTVPGELIHIAG